MRKAVLCAVLCLSGCSARSSGENGEAASQHKAVINKKITADTKVINVINDEDFK